MRPAAFNSRTSSAREATSGHREQGAAIKEGRRVEQIDSPHKLAAEHGGRLKVTVDAGNEWASKALLRAGFVEFPVKFYAYRP